MVLLIADYADLYMVDKNIKTLTGMKQNYIFAPLKLIITLTPTLKHTPILAP